MTLTEEGWYRRKLEYENAVNAAIDEAPPGFELVGFLWGEDLHSGAIFSPWSPTKTLKMSPTNRPLYARTKGNG